MSDTDQCARCGGDCPMTSCPECGGCENTGTQLCPARQPQASDREMPRDGEASRKTVIKTGWGTTIRIIGNARVITGRVQNFTATPDGWRLTGSTPDDDNPDAS